MQQITIKEGEAGGRLDKFLHRFLPQAPNSFLYKMMRKKNITLNEKKAEGKELLCGGDVIKLYLSDETILNFQQSAEEIDPEYERAYKELQGIKIVYEDEHILIADKPPGILSQKAAAGDLSLNEWLVGYLLQKRHPVSLKEYRPSVCNRLDRNTAGLVICAKTLKGSREINRLIQERRIRKYYRMLVKGVLTEEGTLKGYLMKDPKTNRVSIEKEPRADASCIVTQYYPLQQWGDVTLVEAELITGKSHQIRAHMASIGHPLVGDYKYGDRSFNNVYKRKYNIDCQLLWACRLEFPVLTGLFAKLSEKKIAGGTPEAFRRIWDGNMELQRP